MKPHIPVTLVCVDTTSKVFLAERAIRKCLELASFDDVKLLTHDPTRTHAVSVPTLSGLREYSNFITRKLHQYIQTSHCLLIQSDGYIVNPEMWDNTFLQYDFIGAVWSNTGRIGNGGFSLRSKKFLSTIASFRPGEDTHPEDAWSTLKYGSELTSRFGIRFPNIAIANRFSFEGRIWDGTEWNGTPDKWKNSFGFHSWLSVLPDVIDKPIIFHHSGDAGDVIYGLAVVKAMGGGVIFLSPDNRYPYPVPTRWQQEGGKSDWANNLAPLLEAQDYVWSAKYTHKLPYSCSVDLNCFRKFYKAPSPYNFRSLFDLHQLACGTSWPQQNPWLSIPDPEPISDRPIIINRTNRYHNDRFPWPSLLKKHSNQMGFVGTLEEYQRFWWEFKCPEVKFLPTDNLLGTARIIAGAKVFVGNQSCPLAIALALGKNLIVETWKGNANCELNRNNAIHWKSGGCAIPAEWLS